MNLLNKSLIVLFLLSAGAVSLHADDVLFRIGPLDLNIPFKTAQATYLYDFKLNENLIGAETPVLTLWNKLEGTVGAVTSLQGQGTPFIGGNVKLSELLPGLVNFPTGFSVGAFGGRNFNQGEWIYGLKASTRLWQ